jgi:hypothetical protein
MKHKKTVGKKVTKEAPITPYVPPVCTCSEIQAELREKGWMGSRTMGPCSEHPNSHHGEWCNCHQCH